MLWGLTDSNVSDLMQVILFYMSLYQRQINDVRWNRSKVTGIFRDDPHVVYLAVYTFFLNIYV